MTEPGPRSDASAGRWIRFLLMTLPVGTVILGSASFWFYFKNKERKEERTYRHARALRRDPDIADFERYLKIIGDALHLPDVERQKTLASFIESTLGPENMGYEIEADRLQRGGIERVNLSASLPGGKRPSDVVLVLAGYGLPAGHALAGLDAQALALLFVTAHACTGEPMIRTIRFAAIDVSDGSGEAAFDRLDEAIRDDRGRMTQIVALGASARKLADQWAQRPGSGSVAASRQEVTGIQELMNEARALKAVIQQSADRL